MATEERRIPVEEARHIMEKLLHEVDSGARIILTRAGAADILLVKLEQPDVAPKGQPNRGAAPSTLKGQPNRG